MKAQLQIRFPLFPEGLFGKVREVQAKVEANKLEQENEHLKRVIAGYKGWRTKRSKR